MLFTGITTVLTMTFLGLEARTDLPKVPYPTALDFFVFLSFAFIFATIIQVSGLYKVLDGGLIVILLFSLLSYIILRNMDRVNVILVVNLVLIRVVMKKNGNRGIEEKVH